MPYRTCVCNRVRGTSGRGCAKPYVFARATHSSPALNYPAENLNFPLIIIDCNGALLGSLGWRGELKYRCRLTSFRYRPRPSANRLGRSMSAEPTGPSLDCAQLCMPLAQGQRCRKLEPRHSCYNEWNRKKQPLPGGLAATGSILRNPGSFGPRLLAGCARVRVGEY